MNGYKIALITMLSFLTFAYAFISMTDPKFKTSPGKALWILGTNGTMIWLTVMA